MKKVLYIVSIFILLLIAASVYHKEAIAPSLTVSPSSDVVKSADPIFDPARITKKFFGTYVTPANSPVQPEKFTGYHTGVDFETTPAEGNIAVPVTAFCDGKLLEARTATGYGGVAVESCTLNGQAVTIIYGHLNVASIRPAAGQSLKKGDFIGNLGQGYTSQTSGERKHLHFGIHKGTAINILGYVQTQSALSGWLDPMQFLR